MNSSRSEIPVRQFRVVKVGGSLFTLPDLKDRILAWSNSISDPRYVNVWIPGGGSLVDEVRNWQSRHGLDEETAHEISIDMMAQTARLFHTLFGDWPIEREHPALPRYLGDSVSNIVYDCSHWANSNKSLDRSWQTTSDSISLAVAASIDATRLFLLKSTSADSESVSDLSQRSVVDAKFDSLCLENPEILISYTNLRHSIETFDLKR